MAFLRFQIASKIAHARTKNSFSRPRQSLDCKINQTLIIFEKNQYLLMAILLQYPKKYNLLK